LTVSGWTGSVRLELGVGASQDKSTVYVMSEVVYTANQLTDTDKLNSTGTTYNSTKQTTQNTAK